MPTYCHKCSDCGHGFEDIRPMAESAHIPSCPKCGHASPRDYVAAPPQVGFIDGATSGYYGKKSGFPRDPNNPAKYICPSAKAWSEYTKRNDVETIS